MNELIEQNSQNLVQSSTTTAEISRAVQEVQAMVLVAQRVPRNETSAKSKIMEAAKSKTLAQSACYTYYRGTDNKKTKITGPSIRTAETLAKYWGNISYGIKELKRDNRSNSSEMLAYAWDLETNTRAERVFQVEHIRETKNGTTILTNSRDIYELTANNGARRLRACILEVLPSYIVEDFLEECEKTLLGEEKVPFKDRIYKMVKEFENLGVSQDLIEKYIGCNAEKMLPPQFVDLVKIYKTIRDGIKPIDYFFEVKKERVIEKAENVLELKGEVVNEIDKK